MQCAILIQYIFCNGARSEHPWDDIFKDVCGQIGRPTSWAEEASIASAIEINARGTSSLPLGLIW